MATTSSFGLSTVIAVIFFRLWSYGDNPRRWNSEDKQLPSQPSILQYVIREFPDPSQLITQGPTSECFNLRTRESILSSHCKCTSFSNPKLYNLEDHCELHNNPWPWRNTATASCFRVLQCWTAYGYFGSYGIYSPLEVSMKNMAS